MRIAGWIGYYGARFITWVLARFYWRIQIRGSQNIPRTGAFLMCPVHRSNIDGPLTCVFTRRRMRYLSKEEMFKIEWLGKLFWAMGAIPVNRGAPDRKALHACLEAIAAGSPLVLFPEGGRRDGLQVTDIHDGAAYIALKANAPVLPVGISGSEGAQPRGSKFLRPVKVRVVIGEPFSLPAAELGRATRSAIRESSELIRQRVQETFDAAKALA